MAKAILDKHSALSVARGLWDGLSSSTSRVGRYSDLIDLSAVRYPLIEVHFKAKANGTPTANKGVHLFWINHDGDATYPLIDDGATFDAAMISGREIPAASSLTQFNAQFLGSLWSGGTPTSDMVLGPGTFRFPHPGVKGAFLIYHDLGITLTQGDQEVVNGGFTSDTVWVKGTGWTIAAGVATHAAGNASGLEQSNILTIGKTYRLTFTVSGRTAGSIFCNSYGSSPARTANGTYVEDFTATIDDLIFFTSITFDGSIDNVSCVLVEPDPVNLIRWRGVGPELQ